MATNTQIIIENIFLGFFLTLICVFGIIGNLISFSVLCHQQGKKSRTNSINYFLIGLSLCDVLFLFTWLNVGILYTQRLFSGDEPSESFSTASGAYFGLIIRPLGYIGQAGGNLFTIAITVDRYLAVCHVLLAKRIWSQRLAFNLSVAIFLSAIIFSIPIWLALQVGTVEDGFVVRSNDFGKSSQFTAYNLWLFTSINTIIPFPILIVLNAFIFNKVHEARLQQASMTKSQVSEISLARMLLCVVLVFCICNIPAIIRAIIFSVSADTDLIRLSDAGRLEQYFPYTILRIFDWLCIAINSGVNFIIYCIMSRSFRKSLMELLALISQSQCLLVRKYFPGTTRVTKFFSESTLDSGKK